MLVFSGRAAPCRPCGRERGPGPIAGLRRAGPSAGIGAVLGLVSRAVVLESFGGPRSSSREVVEPHAGFAVQPAPCRCLHSGGMIPQGNDGALVRVDDADDKDPFSCYPLFPKPIDAKEARMLPTNVTSPRRVVNGLGSRYLDGQVPPRRTLQVCGHRISIAYGDRFPRPRMRMGSRP